METRLFSFSVPPTLIVTGAGNSIHVHSVGTSTGFAILVQVTNSTGLPDTTGTAVTYNQQGNKLTITEQTTSSIDLDIKVPATSVVQVDSQGGSVNIDGVNGGVTVRSNNSDVALNNVNGQITVEAGNGSFTATNVNGQVNATTDNGDIGLMDSTLKGRSLLKSTNGDITYVGSIDPHGDYQVETISGNINFTLPSHARFSLHVSSSGGSINNGFVSTTVGNEPRPTLTFTTVNGDINLFKGL